MTTEKTFVTVIDKMRHQNDKDLERAKQLSVIYGSDIDPVNNKLLTDAIWEMFNEIFNEEQVELIQFFCYEQDFGRIVNKSTQTLYNQLIEQIDVKGAKQIDPDPSIH